MYSQSAAKKHHYRKWHEKKPSTRYHASSRDLGELFWGYYSIKKSWESVKWYYEEVESAMLKCSAAEN